MWFLEADIALRLLTACALWAVLGLIAQKYGAQERLNRFLILPDLILIGWVSPRLALFYAAYTLLTWALAALMFRADKGRRALFPLFCLICALPFLYLRAGEIFPELPLIFALTGIAYNMLKAIDAIYYVYYTGERVPLLTYANYMLFFPVITAGPIMRYRDFAASFAKPQPISGELITNCFKRLIRGYFKKVVVLSLVSILLTRLASATPRVYISVAACGVSYLLLWLDMSGYADIAIALGGLLGVPVPENFKKPLKAASFTQFWRNWHVSLTDWIREHIFVVLGNRRLNKYQGALIGFSTMMVMNLWHGFTLTFLADGLLNGIILACENLFGLTTVNRRKVGRSYYVFRCCLTNLIFAFTTIFYTLTPEQLSCVLRGFISL